MMDLLMAVALWSINRSDRVGRRSTNVGLDGGYASELLMFLQVEKVI